MGYVILALRVSAFTSCDLYKLMYSILIVLLPAVDKFSRSKHETNCYELNIVRYLFPRI